jgi:hypothetical protein
MTAKGNNSKQAQKRQRNVPPLARGESRSGLRPPLLSPQQQKADNSFATKPDISICY